MSDIVIFSEGNNRVLAYKKSVNTPDYDKRTDVLINPDVNSLLSNAVPMKYWIHEKGSVREMIQAEKDQLDAFLKAQGDAQKTTNINNLDITIKDAFVAWLQVYNSKVPAQFRVTPTELKNKVLENEGL